jgi:hypothetical protein
VAKYSNIKDVDDEIIKVLSKESDHEEAADYIDKVLVKCGVDPKGITVTPLLADLSTTYAIYKRSFYESISKDDVFYQKYITEEKMLRILTSTVIKKYINSGNKIFTTTAKGEDMRKPSDRSLEDPASYDKTDDEILEGISSDRIEEALFDGLNDDEKLRRLIAKALADENDDLVLELLNKMRKERIELLIEEELSK